MPPGDGPAARAYLGPLAPDGWQNRMPLSPLPASRLGWQQARLSEEVSLRAPSHELRHDKDDNEAKLAYDEDTMMTITMATTLMMIRVMVVMLRSRLLLRSD